MLQHWLGRGNIKTADIYLRVVGTKGPAENPRDRGSAERVIQDKQHGDIT